MRHDDNISFLQILAYVYTFNGDSVGANSLELFLHFSINVNLPVFPVAAKEK